MLHIRQGQIPDARSVIAPQNSGCKRGRRARWGGRCPSMNSPGQATRARAAVAAGDGEAARKLLPETVGQIDKAAKKGVVHDNAAARYKSRLARKVSALPD